MSSETPSYYFPLNLDPTVSPFFANNNYLLWNFDNFINYYDNNVQFNTLKSTYQENLTKIANQPEVPRYVKTALGRYEAASKILSEARNDEPSSSVYLENSVYAKNSTVFYNSTPPQTLSPSPSYKFINSNPTSYYQDSRKRKASAISNPTTSRPRIEFTENDNVFIDNLEPSIGSYIGTLARNTIITSYVIRYFVICGMNGILDLTELHPQSQMMSLSPDVRDRLNALFPYSLPLPRPKQIYCKIGKCDQQTSRYRV
jgi:hypothetical protein